MLLQPADAIARPRRLAFFDVDETLVTEKTMFTIASEIGRKIDGFNAEELIGNLHKLRAKGCSRKEVNRVYYHGLAGLMRNDVLHVANDYIIRRIDEDGLRPFFIKPALQRLRALQDDGAEVVFVSGSAVDFLVALARHLNVGHVLATQLETDHSGRYTGQISGRSMIGDGKADAVSEFLAHCGAEADLCYGFGDHPSDAGFISLIGTGMIIAGNQDAEEIALKHGWEVLQREPAAEALSG